MPLQELEKWEESPEDFALEDVGDGWIYLRKVCMPPPQNGN
jgi:hypothetical protein